MGFPWAFGGHQSGGPGPWSVAQGLLDPTPEPIRTLRDPPRPPPGPRGDHSGVPKTCRSCQVSTGSHHSGGSGPSQVPWMPRESTFLPLASS